MSNDSSAPRRSFVIVLILAFLVCPLMTRASDESGTTTTTLAQLLEPIRKKHKLPCLGAAVIVEGKLAGVGVVGVRKLGADVPAQTTDLFHLGSCTKAMTATVIARMVEEGALKWNRPLEKYFPDWKEKIHPDYRRVTLKQLLCHRAGLPDNPSFVLRLKGLSAKEAESPALRLEVARAALAGAPASAPGTKFAYSNTGYILAAAIAEKVTGKTWEKLMREKLFQPLNMTTAGFGPPGDAQKIDQPWPHKTGLFGGVSPIAPGDLGSDNPPFYASAGTVHCSLADWEKFTLLHLGHPENSNIVTSATLTRLHSLPFGGDYGYGWSVVERDWAGGKALTHAGSNTVNFAVIWLAPRKDFAVLIVTNRGGDSAFEACDKAAGALIKRYLKGNQ